MLRSVFLKTLRDHRRSMVLWSVGLAFLAILMMAFYPSIQGMEGLDELLAQYPEDLMALIGATDMASLTTPAGYLNAELFGFMLPILFVVFAIGQGSAAIAGEERTGTMELLLAQPISRGRLVLEKFASMVVSTVGLALVGWLALVAGKVAIDMDISVVRLAEGIVSVTLLGLAFGAAALAIGSITGSRGLSTGAAAAAAVGTYVLHALGLIVDFMEPARWLSPFYYYSANTPLANGLSPAHVAALSAVVLVCLAVAYFGFQRRDVRL